jgi:hypothetical protein
VESMRFIRPILQKAAVLFASRVARNSLFEQPGEREMTPPLKPGRKDSTGGGESKAQKEGDLP